MMKNPFFWFLFLYFIFGTALIVATNARRLRGRNFSRKLSSNFHESIDSNKNECQNSDSPAEDCFDYLKLALFWPKTYAYQTQKRGVNVRHERLINKWIIHGLWAEKYPGKTPGSCRRRNIKFHSEILKKNSLFDKLRSMWFSLMNDESFWKHEWDAHGSCASRVPALDSIEKYFGKTIEMFENLDINSKLDKDKSLKPGFTTSVENLNSHFENQIGKKIRLTFTRNLKTNELYLKEIHICYDLLLKLINCPGVTNLSNDIKYERVKYLNSVPI